MANSPPATLLNPKAYPNNNGIADPSFPASLSASLTLSQRASSAPPLSSRSPDSLFPAFAPLASPSYETLDDLALTLKGNSQQIEGPKVPSQTTSFTPINSIDPKLLLNPKGALKRERDVSVPTSGSKHGETAKPHVPTNSGMGGMIEKMHNVGKRDDQPRKRIKSTHVVGVEAEDHNGKKSTSRFHGSSGSGVIGDYVRAKREEGLSKAGPQASIVDLTNGMCYKFSSSFLGFGAR